LDKVDEEKRNILHRASLQIKLSIIKDIEANLTHEYVNKLDKFGNSPLILACKLPSKLHFSERNKIIEILIKAGADIQCIEPINGWTALHWCCFNGDLASAKTLIINGANFFLPSKSGHFPIDLAGEKSKGDLVKYLINITIKYLERIKDYELLQIETYQNNNNLIKHRDSDVLFDNINRSLNTFSSLSKETYTKKESNNSGKKNNNILIDLSKLSKIEQTVYLRLFTEHCLYWASYYNFNGEIIDKFLNNFYAHAAFPIFCLENRTAMHAACIQGSQIPLKKKIERLCMQHAFKGVKYLLKIF
jgi:ankyrin repeat protein